MYMKDEASERIKRIRHRYLEDMPGISIERARYYTEKWRETEKSNFSPGVRVALSMKNVYEKMRINLDPDDRICGTWTEYYLGIPIDIERGLFNETLRIELDRLSMAGHLARSNLRFIGSMIRRYGLLTLYRNMKHTADVGVAMPSIGLSPMSSRKINPYRITSSDKKELHNKLFPYWKGKTIADLLKTALESSNVYTGDILSFSAALPSTTSRNDTIISTGSAIGTWQGHLILDHETPLKKGLLGMHEEIRERLNSKDLTSDQREFLKSIDIALEGVIIYAGRLVETISRELEQNKDPQRGGLLQRQLEICKRVPLYPPQSFSEAVQSYWTIKTAVELSMPFNVHAPGRLDQLFFPYYIKDIKEGKISREEARELLEELFLKVMSHNMRPYSNFISYFTQRYEGSEPVTMGGLTDDAKDATNNLTYVMLEAAADSKAALNFVVRLHKNSPPELFRKIAELHHEGNSSISVMNDEVSIKALEKRGFSHKDALGYAITGCVDMVAPGKTGGEAFCALLLSRILDMTLRNGDSQTVIGMVEGIGLKTGNPDTFITFDQLVDAFVEQTAFQIKKLVEATYIRDSLYAEHLPAPYISAFMQGCLDNGRDITAGGAVYDLEGILFMNSIANVVDSLFVMKKLIFEQKRFTFKDLLNAVDKNFEGYENIYQLINEVEGKWGNGNPESDSIAHDVTKRIFEETFHYHTYKGGFYAPFVNSMTTHTYDGRISTATPDGRKAAKPYAASCNPYNVEKCGITGVLRSVAAIDFSNVMGCAVNIRLHPSSIGQTEEARKKWIALLKTYFRLGGEQLQPTVVSTEVLKAAQKDRENYRNVIVKVGGYSAYFVDLGYEIQNEIIERTEHRGV
ncbi:MAG: pyruvate formate lyase family protein [Dehalococcoidia bacterium]